jgi:molybdopterin-containing oxidoreductase family iron-sulfur binding subunit
VGDALTSDGTLVPVQPLIAPLFGGLTELGCWPESAVRQ